MIVVPTGYSGQIPGYPGQTTGHSRQTAGYSGQITTGHSGQTVQSQTQSDPEYQHQMFNNPGLTNVPLNQGPNEELSFHSGEDASIHSAAALGAGGSGCCSRGSAAAPYGPSAAGGCPF